MSRDTSRKIEVHCVQCGVLLFQGTERQAKRLIIYCPECPGEVRA